MKLGMIGLGRMGFGMSARLIAGGHQVVGFDPSEEARQRLEQEGGSSTKALSELVSSLEAPRVVWMMVPSGDPVAQTLAELDPLLSPGDLIVDGGNSNYKATVEHGDRLETLGLQLVDVGTSGGVWGRSEGYSLMAGGDEAAVASLAPVLETLAPAADKGWARVGPRGAGHFVKMIHNGIEYGLMQAYAEGFGILQRKSELELDLHQIAEVWRHGSVVRSWLLDLITNALGENPDLDDLEAWVPDSGEGRWTVKEAIDLDAPAPVITMALIERLSSRDTDSFSHKLLAAMRREFGGHAVRSKS
jgi:6-phosphogluconate dehydrogenase